VPRLCMITVPGLRVASDWAVVHDRLLDDFPDIRDVLATTIPGTLLLVYEGEADDGAWVDGISDGILSCRRAVDPPNRQVHFLGSKAERVTSLERTGTPPGVNAAGTPDSPAPITVEGARRPGRRNRCACTQSEPTRRMNTPPKRRELHE
jgi:hypothetical protein